MPLVYMVRHQTAGVIATHAFPAPLSESELIRFCEHTGVTARHGVNGADGSPLWVRNHEVQVCSRLEDLVGHAPPERDSASSGMRIGIAPMGVDGQGHLAR